MMNCNDCSSCFISFIPQLPDRNENVHLQVHTSLNSHSNDEIALDDTVVCEIRLNQIILSKLTFFW